MADPSRRTAGAARLGRYSIQIQLAHPSPTVNRPPGRSELRDLTRTRTAIVRERAAGDPQRLEKLLEDGRDQAVRVATDITGGLGPGDARKALIEGPARPVVLADLAKRRLR